MIRLLQYLLYSILAVIVDSLKSKSKKTAEYIKKEGRNDFRNAVRRRVRLQRTRRALQLLFNFILILIAASSAFLIYCLHVRWGDNLLVFIIDVYIIIDIVKTLSSMEFGRLGHISTLVASDVIDQGLPYALYLRSFQADWKRDNFQEEELVLSLLQNKVLTYTIGMPEEVDTSIGAARIYIANDTWQEDVRRLMEKASFLFVRICDTEPCLWELQQALVLPQQLFIIVDDYNEYISVYSKCPQIPKIIKPDKVRCAIYARKEDGDWDCIYLLPQPKEAKERKMRRRKHLRTNHNSNVTMTKVYTKRLLKHFSVPKDGDISDYETCIEGILSNMMNEMEQDDNVLVVTRIVDLLEVYYTLGSGKQCVIDNIRGYLSQLERFNNLTEELHQRIEIMSAKVI